MYSLRASVVVVDPSVGATCVVPVASISAIYLEVSTLLDTTGRFRFIGEIATVADGRAYAMTKPLANSILLSDAATVLPVKGLSETPEVADSISVLLLILRQFDDVFDVSDIQTTVFTPAVKAEQISVVDVDTLSYQKNLADSFEEDDDADIVDGLQHVTAKSIGNQVSSSDARSLIFAASRVESITVSDVGILTVQDYCDLSYFAQDYVGSSQSF